MIRIYCKNTKTFKEFQECTTLQEMLPSFDFAKPWPIIAAKVNNVVEGLKFRAFNNRDVEFLDYTTYAGRSLYCRSLCFLLAKASRDIFPDSRITLRRPISKGYLCNLRKNNGGRVTAQEVEKIAARMRELVEKDFQFHRHDVQTPEAIEIFRKMGFEDKVKLLETTGSTYTTYYTLDGTADYFYDTLVPSTGFLKVWELKLYKDGMMILRVPDRHQPDQLAPFAEQPKTFEVFTETLRWNRMMGLTNVGDVNKACLSGRSSELIQVSEALQDKKIVQIADEIQRRYTEQGVRLVLITGPSSSGKTTFSMKLRIQLIACGLRPLTFSTDDYFVNREETPRMPDGSYDFDNFDTVDHDLLQKELLRILAGEEVDVPEFNFVTGLREYNGKKLKLENQCVIILEGIHALNPMLTNLVPEDKKYKIFINAMTSISLDDHNTIPTSDYRLLRRILRDFNKGAFTAQQTIAQWPNVRRSEVKWIYPFQENADVLFNSAYLIEFAVLRTHLEQILVTVPKNCPEYSETHRLLKFLSYFVPVPDKEIPPTSLLREFVGGSSFKY